MCRLLLVICLLVFAAYALLMPNLWASREQVRAEIPAGYIIPSKFSRILALGNHGLLADFLFLKTATFIGGRSNIQQSMNEDDWVYVAQSLDVVTDLDPYFLDPYMLAEGLLAWDARRIDEANKLLEKGTRYREQDWKLLFFIGFNNFYFLKDYATASDYIMRASRLPGSPAYLKTLAARLGYYGGKSKTALLFLKEMLAETDNILLKRNLETRLTALERAVEIEEALQRFRSEQGKVSVSLDELLAAGYLQEIPVDPYGGQWVINKNGRVFSTSKFADTKSEKSENR